MMRTVILASLATLVVASRGDAQGALSTQGLGYPPGQMSARAEGTGGAVADFDPLSLVSPSSIVNAAGSAVFFQYSPEFRSITAGSGKANTTTARFPLVSGVLPIGEAWALGFSSSSFLDRSSETSLVRPRLIGTDSVNETEQTKVLGAINDVRLALAWARSPAFRVGAGAHVFAGSNRLTLSQIFPDSSVFISTTQTARISYVGFAASLGLEFHPASAIGLAVSGRKGGNIRAQSGDTLLGTGRLPDHYSASVSFDGITGATIAARVAHDSWSSLNGLSPSLQGFDGWDYSVGAEATGPRVVQRLITVRLGARSRTLPFGFNGQKVSETSFMGGLGIPLTRDRAGLDIALQRASRSAGGDIKERGIILSFGLRVSP